MNMKKVRKITGLLLGSYLLEGALGMAQEPPSAQSASNFPRIRKTGQKRRAT